MPEIPRNTKGFLGHVCEACMHAFVGNEGLCPDPECKGSRRGYKHKEKPWEELWWRLRSPKEIHDAADREMMATLHDDRYERNPSRAVWDDDRASEEPTADECRAVQRRLRAESKFAREKLEA